MSCFNWDSKDPVTYWDISLTEEEKIKYKDMIFEKEGILYLDHPDLPISKIC